MDINFEGFIQNQGNSQSLFWFTDFFKVKIQVTFYHFMINITNHRLIYSGDGGQEANK